MSVLNFFRIFLTALKTMQIKPCRVSFQTKLKCGLERDPVKVELVVPLYNEPLFLGYVLVAPVENWVLGYRTEYNFDEKGFDKHALCLGYNNGRTEVGLKL